METITISALRQNIKTHLEEVSKSNEPLTIARPQGEPVVLMSKEKYLSIISKSESGLDKVSLEHLLARQGPELWSEN